MKRIYLILFMGLSITGFTESITYSVYSIKRKIGQLIITKTEQKGTVEIKVKSEVTFGKLRKMDISYTLNTVYKENELHSNLIRTYLNGKLRSTIKTERVGDQYVYSKDGEKHGYKEKINYAESLLYFVEPKVPWKVYSEFDGVEKSISNPEPNHYLISNPKNGHVSEYFYVNGRLQAAIIQHSLMTFYLQKH